MASIDPPSASRTTARPRSGQITDIPADNGVTGTTKIHIFVVFYLVMIMLPFTLQAGPITLSPVRIIALVLTVPLLANLLSGKYGRLNLVDIMLFAYVFWQGVAISYWHGTQAIEFVGSTGIEAMCGYLVARAYVRSVQDFEALAKVFTLFVLITVPFAAIEALFDQRLVIKFFEAIPGIKAYNESTAEVRLGMNRAQVNFSHAIHYGVFSAIGFAMAFLVVRPYIGSAMGWVCSVSLGLGSFFSLSSGGFLVFVLQAGLIGWRWICNEMKIASPWVLFFTLFGIFYLIIEVLSDRSAFMVLLTAAAFSAHNAYWRTILFDYAMQNVGDSPLVGVGLNDWDRPVWITHGSLDNFWAYVALVYGVPAFIFLSTAVLWPLFRAMRLKISVNNDRLRRARAAWVLTISALVLAMCTVHLWGKVYSLFFFVLGTGIWLMQVPPDDEKGNPAALGRSRRAPSSPASAAEPAADEAIVAAKPQIRYTRFPKESSTDGRGRRQ